MSDDWKPDKLLTYRYVSDYCTVIFSVPVMSDWSEEECDSAGLNDLKSYVTNAGDYWLDDVIEQDLEVGNAYYS